MATKAYRTFSGNEAVVFSKGSLALTGAVTFMALLKLDAAGNGNYQSIIGGNSSGGSFVWQFSRIPTDVLQLNPGTGGTTFTVTPSDGWVIVAVTKASGTVAPRGHVYKSSAWTHQNFGSTQGNLSSWDVPRVGWSSATDPLDADVHFAAVWESALSDGDIESIISGGFIDDAAIAALSPASLWYFDQASISTPVPDLGSAGADESSHTGTTAASGDIPLYDEDLAVLLPDADVTTTGWTTTPLYSKINDSSDATVITATAS